MNNVGFLALALFFNIAFQEIIGGENNQENDMESWANISNSIISISLFDTMNNKQSENIEDKVYPIQSICKVDSYERIIKKCPSDSIILIENPQSENEIQNIISNLHKNAAINNKIALIASSHQLDPKSQLGIPKLIFLSTNSGLLKEDQSYNLRHYYGYICSNIRAPLYYYLFTSIGWALLLLMWSVSIYKIYKHQAVCIHRMIFYIVGLRFALDLFFLLKMGVCSPLYEPVAIDLALTSLNTMFHCYMCAIILSISMGISIITDAMGRQQFLRIMFITLGSYLINSAYYIFGESGAVFMNISRVMMVGLCISMGYLVTSNSIPHITNMRRAMRNVHDPQLAGFRTAFCTKMCMYISFIIVMLIYYGAIVSEQIYIMIYQFKQRTQHILEGLENIVCLFAFASIMVIFHPCFFGSNFRNAEIDFKDNQVPFQYAVLKADCKLSKAVKDSNLPSNLIIQIPLETMTQNTILKSTMIARKIM